MDGSAPWRVLENSGGSAANGASDAEAPPERRPVLVWLGLAGAVAILAVAAVIAIGSSTGAAVEVEGGVASGGAGAGGPAGGEIVIEVRGAVARPGVYRLAAGSRVADAIAAAGGYGPRVAAQETMQLDLAVRLSDGATVVVPSRDDPPAAPTSGAGGSRDGAGGSLLDLNTATAAELEALPGIGPVTAAKIVDARSERPFSSVDELRERGLVGPKTFERLRELVTVR